MYEIAMRIILTAGGCLFTYVTITVLARLLRKSRMHDLCTLMWSGTTRSYDWKEESLQKVSGNVRVLDVRGDRVIFTPIGALDNSLMLCLPIEKFINCFTAHGQPEKKANKLIRAVNRI